MPGFIAAIIAAIIGAVLAIGGGVALTPAEGGGSYPEQQPGVDHRLRQQLTPAPRHGRRSSGAAAVAVVPVLEVHVGRLGVDDRRHRASGRRGEHPREAAGRGVPAASRCGPPRRSPAGRAAQLRVGQQPVELRGELLLVVGEQTGDAVHHRLRDPAR